MIPAPGGENAAFCLGALPSYWQHDAADDSIWQTRALLWRERCQEALALLNMAPTLVQTAIILPTSSPAVQDHPTCHLPLYPADTQTARFCQTTQTPNIALHEAMGLMSIIQGVVEQRHPHHLWKGLQIGLWSLRGSHAPLALCLANAGAKVAFTDPNDAYSTSIVQTCTAKRVEPKDWPKLRVHLSIHPAWEDAAHSTPHTRLTLGTAQGPFPPALCLAGGVLAAALHHQGKHPHAILARVRGLHHTLSALLQS